MLLEVKNLYKKYDNDYVLKNISFNIEKGKFFSIVGKSGIGKSTIAKILIGIEKKDSGTILFEGKDLSQRKIEDIQMIFQDPYSSLNEKMTVYELLSEPLIVNSYKNINKKVNEMLEFINMSDFKNRYPNSLSGGQRQRIVVACALILKPKLVICDEPLSALDLSTQNQIVKLLQRFNKEYKTSFIFISHDTDLVEYLSDNIFYLGGKNYESKNKQS